MIRKNMTNVNLVKIAEINQIKKEMDYEKQKAGETIASLHQKLKLQEQELNLTRQNEEQLKN